MIKILYFAWLRERTGTGEEALALPEGVVTVGGLMAWLATRHPRAFEPKGAIRCAVNQDFAELGAPVRDGDEVAFFPPVTGG